MYFYNPFYLPFVEESILKFKTIDFKYSVIAFTVNTTLNYYNHSTINLYI